MQKKTTDRGFSYYEFKDLYKLPCSIQKSSLATDEAIWIGVDSNRMHLNRDQISALLPILQNFIQTGEI